MDSIIKIFKIGRGPSSSHTMGPEKAAREFLAATPEATCYNVKLYGSLAATGKGHMTDVAILSVLTPEHTTIEWYPDQFLPEHPNGMLFQAYNNEGELIKQRQTFSIGGGDISDDGKRQNAVNLYPHSSMNDILKYIGNRRLWEYVDEFEDRSVLWDYLLTVWRQMQQEICDGLEHESTLPGILHLPRKASATYSKLRSYSDAFQKRYLTGVYALAAAEENAAGQTIVTAPTCGSCGVIPAVLYSYYNDFEKSDKKILHALATAGLIGNLIKNNASISGAEVGCQGEIGSACSMASAAICQLMGGSSYQVEYAAEIGLEHHLGLTCDPVCGLVQVPCIERNGFAAMRAIDAGFFALLSDGKHLISFDKVVNVMKITGHDLPSLYKETSTGGLAL